MNLQTFKIPPYVSELYPSYFSVFRSKIEMHKAYACLTTFFYAPLLHREVVDMLAYQEKVLQIGVVGAGFESKILNQIGEDGDLTVMDLSDARLSLCEQQTGKRKNLHFERADARLPLDKKYGTIVAPFVLHEMPDESKKAVIKNALNALSKNGTLIVLDYHAPAKANLLRLLVRPYNRLREPFAESLAHYKIEAFLPNASKYTVERALFCAGLYQITAIKKKAAE